MCLGNLSRTPTCRDEWYAKLEHYSCDYSWTNLHKRFTTTWRGTGGKSSKFPSQYRTTHSCTNLNKIFTTTWHNTRSKSSKFLSQYLSFSPTKTRFGVTQSYHRFLPAKTARYPIMFSYNIRLLVKTLQNTHSCCFLVLINDLTLKFGKTETCGRYYVVEYNTHLMKYMFVFYQLPGVQVWYADFRQQMVQRSGLCYKDLTLHYFVVSSTSVWCARVINWKSLWIVLCCSVQYVEIYTERRVFVDSINLLFSFEKNCCRIIPITSRSLWWICSIARYTWTMVSAFQ